MGKKLDREISEAATLILVETLDRKISVWNVNKAVSRELQHDRKWNETQIERIRRVGG